MTTRFTKDPDAVLDYVIDWSAWLVDDTIIDSAWTVGAGLTSTGTAYTTTTATIWLSGGTAGSAYQATNRITTAVGRVADQTITILVEEQ